jgi:hypothetical protein
MSQQRRPKQQTDRIRHARQVLAGDAVRPAPDPWAVAEGGIPLTPLQRNFLIILAALLIIGGILAFSDLLLLATIPFFILAIGLIAARFVF